MVPFPSVAFIDPKTGRTFLNLTEIASRWGVTIASVLRYHLGTDKLSGIRVGNAHYVDVDQLSKYEATLVEKIKKKIAVQVKAAHEKIARLSKPLKGTVVSGD